jgi:cation:H+ antiporter
METLLIDFITKQSLPVLLAIIAVTIYTLSKGADILVEEAVALSLRWGVTKVIIGATIVSLGTTMPEAAVSVYAAIEGQPGIALGNAVGSIICDTGLILGLATLMSPLPMDRKVVNRQGWIQLGAGVLLVLACIPFGNLSGIFKDGGLLPQFMGFIFLGLLLVYLWQSIRWARQNNNSALDEVESKKAPTEAPFLLFLKLLAGMAIVVISSRLLIPAVQETAIRINVPDSIIGATLVAFGTSLPELVTAMTAVKKGHGELAIGNVIGADILNVLFVAGAAASVTRGGLNAPVHFFTVLFPAMLFILIIFRVGVYFSKEKLQRPFGAILLGTYVLVTVVSYRHLF